MSLIRRLFSAKRKIIGGVLIGLSLVAVGKLVGPFFMASVATYAGMTYAEDEAGLFSAAVNLPRAIMNVSVGSIKKGDIVRIVYPDNSVYDFEAERGCAYALSRACEYSKVTRVSSADSARP